MLAESCAEAMLLNQSSYSKRHSGDRERPHPSRCIGVFGLSIYTNERELRDFFAKYGRVEDVQVVYDAQTGRSRGFGFVYYETEDDAHEAKEKANGEHVFSAIILPEMDPYWREDSEIISSP